MLTVGVVGYFLGFIGRLRIILLVPAINLLNFWNYLKKLREIDKMYFTSFSCFIFIYFYFLEKFVRNGTLLVGFAATFQASNDQQVSSNLPRLTSHFKTEQGSSKSQLR